MYDFDGPCVPEYADRSVEKKRKISFAMTALKIFLFFVACAVAWLKPAVSLHQKKTDTMKNTEYSLDTLGSVISSDALSALAGLIDDLGLEVMGVNRE